MSYLIILTFGPVQTYISQARRTQDLLQGSRILSHLADEGVRYITNQRADVASVIYPTLQNNLPDEIAGTPNRIVARVQGSQADAVDIANGVKSAIENTWQALSDTVLAYFISHVMPDTEGEDSVREIWQRQRDSWLEIYYVVREENGDYDSDITATNEDLAARKMIRNFGQIEEYGLKCSITGEHEALYNGVSYRQFWEKVKNHQPNLSLFGQHERLSAIATIKRIAHDCYAPLKLENRFPSTSSIASIPFKFDVLSMIASDRDTSDLETAITEYVNSLLKMFKQEKDLFIKHAEYFGQLENKIPDAVLSEPIVKQFRRIDGDFLYEDTLISTTVQEYSNHEPKPDDLNHARKTLGRLVSTASSYGIAPPQPYYVILSMDGDNMGKLLGCVSHPDEHTKFSDVLARYAEADVIRIVQDENLGRLVYAGGDDVMALLPVRNALTVANALRQAFTKTVRDGKVKNKKGNLIEATASTGLAFVHHTHNLQQAVDEANNAQKNDAKKRQDRNALAIRLLRRSGEPRFMQHDWHFDDKNVNEDHLTKRIQQIVIAFSDGGLSRTLPYDLANIHYSMGTSTMPPQAIKDEMVRVVRRHLPSEKRKNAEAIVENLLMLSDNPELQSIDKQLLNMMRLVELARFIAQSTTKEQSK